MTFLISDLRFQVGNLLRKHGMLGRGSDHDDEGLEDGEDDGEEEEGVGSGGDLDAVEDAEIREVWSRLGGGPDAILKVRTLRCNPLWGEKAHSSGYGG